MRTRILFPAALLISLAPVALPAQKGRDLSKLDACKVLMPSDVTSATKRKLVKSVGGAVHCMYLVEAPNSGADTYDFYLNEAAVIEALLGVESPKEKGTPVPGLWTEAYVRPSVGSPTQLSLVALKKGDMAIEIQGPSKEVLISLAHTAVGRLK
jgi:hypothetical protein